MNPPHPHVNRPGLMDPRHGSHDPNDEHYRQWREEHARQLDDDYRAWCEERYQRFCSEFDRWRAQRGSQHLHHAASQDPTPDETPSLSIGP
ncbi:hypothetical protein M8A51_09260 [Schlegelella sp. S2-27]|uniref:Uncharacterized protein n=1 Tax=Caldimonas mangrovi TaxID=2944811 RepID=A0ABT0YLW4_9BURK|nr:hypothetical protein [Caldimonas mangrovi]MCM5679722.1 hypothetical protein [Caldimonas mangrovi]